MQGKVVFIGPLPGTLEPPNPIAILKRSKQNAKETVFDG